jgi:hypothetical protein
VKSQFPEVNFLNRLNFAKLASIRNCRVITIVAGVDFGDGGLEAGWAEWRLQPSRNQDTIESDLALSARNWLHFSILT